MISFPSEKDMLLKTVSRGKIRNRFPTLRRERVVACRFRQCLPSGRVGGASSTVRVIVRSRFIGTVVLTAQFGILTGENPLPLGCGSMSTFINLADKTPLF